MIWWESIEHDYIRSLKSQYYKRCQLSLERRVLNLESEVMRGLGSIPTVGGGGKILSMGFLFFMW